MKRRFVGALIGCTVGCTGRRWAGVSQLGGLLQVKERKEAFLGGGKVVDSQCVNKLEVVDVTRKEKQCK